MNSVKAEKYTGFSALVVGTSPLRPFSGLTGFACPTVALLSFEGSACRFRLDGVTAHSASGHIASAGNYFTLQGADTIFGFTVVCTNTTGNIMVSLGEI